MMCCCARWKQGAGLRAKLPTTSWGLRGGGGEQGMVTHRNDDDASGIQQPAHVLPHSDGTSTVGLHLDTHMEK